MAERRSKCRAVGPYLPWRRRVVDAYLREQWQEAVRLARKPITYAATEENCPLPCGVDRMGDTGQAGVKGGQGG